MRGKVLSIIKNQKGFYGFIKTKEENYYYDSTSVVKGNFLKIGTDVEFDVIPIDGGKRTKAINVKKVQLKSLPLETSLKQTVWNLIASNIGADGYLDLAVLAQVLLKNVIDYKQYSDTFVSFLERNFANFIFLGMYRKI